MRLSFLLSTTVLAALAIASASAQTSVDRTFIDQGQRIRIDFRQGDTLTLAPPANSVLYMDGRETPVSNLQRGAKLNFYVPEDQLTAQFFADDTASKPVVVPIVSEQAVVSEQSQPAQATMERQNVAALELPATASNLPLVAWFGVMFIVAGASATMMYRWLRR